MRLSNMERNVIREEAMRSFGADSTVLLFGSRVDDSRRGGDVDLLVIASGSDEELFERKLRATGKIQRKLGDRKIDMVTRNRNSEENAPTIVQEALKTGVVL